MNVGYYFKHANDMTTPQTTTLETSKKLCALGVPQESCFYWKFSEVQQKYVLVDYTALKIDHTKKPREWDYIAYSAYLSDEIGRWLPWQIEKLWIAPNKSEIKEWYLEIYKHDFDKRVGDTDKWNVVYSSNTNIYLIHMANQVESEARSLMLIYLIENGYVDVKSLTPKQEDENER